MVILIFPSCTVHLMSAVQCSKPSFSILSSCLLKIMYFVPCFFFTSFCVASNWKRLLSVWLLNFVNWWWLIVYDPGVIISGYFWRFYGQVMIAYKFIAKVLMLGISADKTSGQFSYSNVFDNIQQGNYCLPLVIYFHQWH